MNETMDTEFVQIPLKLISDDDQRIFEQREEADRELNREIWGEDQRPVDRHFKRPPGRPDLSYEEVGRIEREHRARWSSLIQKARSPKSQVMAQKNAWAWNLDSLADKLDDFTKKMLQKFDLYLCRYIMRLVEAKDEKVEWATLELANPESVIYRIWPSEQFATKSTISANASLGAKVGLTKELDIVELSANVGGGVVWQAEWKWIVAIIKAWGSGDFAAGWELKRDSAAPFAGDREFFLLLQMPPGKEPTIASASVSAKINPAGWFNSYVYDNKDTGPVKIQHHVV